MAILFLVSLLSLPQSTGPDLKTEVVCNQLTGSCIMKGKDTELEDETFCPYFDIIPEGTSLYHF